MKKGNSLFQARRKLSHAEVLSPADIRAMQGRPAYGRRMNRPGDIQPLQPIRQPGPGMRPGAEYDEIEQLIQGDTIINPVMGHDIGGVSEVPNDYVGEPDFTLEFDNSAGVAPVRYRWGSDRAAELLGLAGLPRATGGSQPPATIDQLFGERPILVGALICSTSSDQQQFSQEFTYHHGGKLNGSNRGSDRFPVNLAKRPTYENGLLLIIQSKGTPWRFGQIELGTVTVLDGEVFTIDFYIAGNSGN